MAGSTPASGWGSRRRAGLVCCAALVVLAVWAGCNVTNENYPILSFFFDGVPDPNAPALPDGTTDLAMIRKSPTYTIHQPFAEDKCVECHGRRFNMEGVEPTACLACHENIPSSQPRMHGPVVTVACLWCHAPHESPYAALFKGPVRQVCSACHAPGMLGTDETPEHLPDAQESCLDCHFGHGGTSRFFLREHGDREYGEGMAPPSEPAASEPPVPEPESLDGSAAPGDQDQAPAETESEP